MAHHFRKGSRVRWTWGAHSGEGRIAEVFTQPVSRQIKGTRVKRDADRDEPAYLIRQQDGDQVLKSASELRRG